MIYQPQFEQSDWSECYNHGRNNGETSGTQENRFEQGHTESMGSPLLILSTMENKNQRSCFLPRLSVVLDIMWISHQDSRDSPSPLPVIADGNYYLQSGKDHPDSACMRKTLEKF